MNAIKQPRSYVSEERAREHVSFTLSKNWIAGVHGFEGWGRAELTDKPDIIHDLNGKILFYEYGIKAKDKIIGNAKASASKILGSPVPQIQLIPRRWDPDHAMLKAKKVVSERYPNAEILETELVCYSYPKIGVRVYINDSKNGAESLIYDVSSLALVDRFGADELEGFSCWSFYDEIAEPDADRKEKRWEAADQELDAVKKRIPRIMDRDIEAGERSEIQRAYSSMSAYGIVIPATSQKIIQYCPHCTTHDCNALHSQQTDYYCAVATGQMILDFYRYYYDQKDIAAAMGTTSGGTGNNGQADGYRKLSNYCLDATIDLSATWAEAKAEIDANRPLKSGIAGHARACFGWKRQNFYIVGTTPKRWLYILDPWPWNANLCKGGGIYWEDWDAINHTNFIYVRHRTTPCK
jgi:hypothetical protein